MKTLIKEYSFDPDHCDLLVDLFHEAHEKGITRPGLVGQNNNDSLVVESVKKSTDLHFVMLEGSDIDPEKYKISELLRCVYDTISDYIKTFNLENILSGLYVKEPFQIHHYAPGEGFYALHADAASYTSMDRVLVFILYLNDVDDGGTFFPWQEYKSVSKKGNLIVFPAGISHPHRGVVSFTQDKYILTGWIYHSPDRSTMNSGTQDRD